MSLNSAMLAGVSGLISNSSALAAISDNIANVNTVGYKRNAVNFNNVVTSQSAGRYSAGGVQGKSTQYVSQQGLLQTSTSSTDIAISGDGFFVVSDSAAKSGNAFTRAGAFQLDADGYLKNPSGYYLQGWAVATDGKAEWKYTLPGAAAGSKLTIVDANGKTVWTGDLVDNGKGEHTVQWDGRDLKGQQLPDGGIYTARFEAQDANGANMPVTAQVTGLATRIQTIDGQTMLTVGSIKAPLTAVTGVQTAPS